MSARLGEIKELQRWLLDRLEYDLRRERPEFVHAFETATDEEHKMRLREGWDDLLGDELPPWPELLTALLDVELKLDEVRHGIAQLGAAVDGQAVHYWSGAIPARVTSCLECLEHLVKRAGRTDVMD